MPKLNWKLLTKKRKSSTQGIPAGKEGLAWVTNTVTLIYGERDTVLVDTFLSEQHSKELLDWVVESGKNLTAIYVTHAHGDHFFGPGRRSPRQTIWRAHFGVLRRPTASTRSAPGRATRIGSNGTLRTWWPSRPAKSCRNERLRRDDRRKRLEF